MRNKLQARFNRLSKTHAITREQALEAYDLHTNKGYGGAGAGYQIFTKHVPIGTYGHQVAALGELACDLGRYYTANPTAETIVQTNKPLVTAINPSHQPTVNRAVKKLVKYNDLNEQRNIADGNSDLKLHAKLNRLCQNTYDEYQDLLFMLPEREQINIEKSNIY